MLAAVLLGALATCHGFAPAPPARIFRNLRPRMATSDSQVGGPRSEAAKRRRNGARAWPAACCLCCTSWGLPAGERRARPRASLPLPHATRSPHPVVVSGPPCKTAPPAPAARRSAPPSRALSFLSCGLAPHPAPPRLASPLTPAAPAHLLPAGGRQDRRRRRQRDGRAQVHRVPHGRGRRRAAMAGRHVL